MIFAVRSGQYKGLSAVARIARCSSSSSAVACKITIEHVVLGAAETSHLQIAADRRRRVVGGVGRSRHDHAKAPGKCRLRRLKPPHHPAQQRHAAQRRGNFARQAAGNHPRLNDDEHGVAVHGLVRRRPDELDDLHAPRQEAGHLPGFPFVAGSDFTRRSTFALSRPVSLGSASLYHRAAAGLARPPCPVQAPSPPAPTRRRRGPFAISRLSGRRGPASPRRTSRRPSP